MRKNLNKKLIESIQSILPITILVVILALIMTDVDAKLIVMFLFGAFLLILGMGFFTLGADISMMPIGNSIGSFLSKAKTKRFPFVALVCILMGFVIAIAEPVLLVLAEQLGGGTVNYTLLLSAAVGVGFFLAASVLKTFFKIKLTYMFLCSYIIVFVLAIALQIVNPSFLAISFDSGGVSTGPVSVPFIMALGIGVSVRGKGGEEDSFGTVALCSIGPIIAVMVLGLTGSASLSVPDYEIQQVTVFLDIFKLFGQGFIHYIMEMLTALAPIVAVFFIFQFAVLRLNKYQIIRIVIGILYTFIGLSIFLTGVNVGFMPMGIFLGKSLAALSYNWIMIPIGMVLGAVIVLAEPAIHVLNKQVEEVSGGAISKRAMLIFLCVGVAVAVGLAMVRVLTGVSIWFFIVPVYVISLAMMFITPHMFTGIAFDSGGVASGPMTATFLLPFAIGACTVLGGEFKVFTDAFGLVAFVAMTPLITIQLLGFVFKFKKHRLERLEAKETHHTADLVEEETIDFDVHNISHLFTNEELAQIEMELMEMEDDN